MPQSVVVVGAGVVGLSCATELVERGHRVHVVASDPTGQVSRVAASLWAPSFVERSERVRGWAYETLARIRRDAAPEAGVREQLSRTIGATPWRPDPWMSGFAPVLRGDSGAALPDGYAAATFAAVPLVDTSRYLPWLRARLADSGVQIEQRALGALDEAADADVVVLAAGWGSAALARDAALYPVRTETLTLTGVDPAHATIVRDGPLAPLFIVPRFDDVVVGGGAERVTAATRAPGPSPDPDLLTRAIAVEPALAGARVTGRAVGLRPARDTVRVEPERIAGRRVVHCYGHGGAGIALSWGTARAAADLVEAA